MKRKASKTIFSFLLLLSAAFMIGCAGMDIETAEKSQYYYVPERLQEANRLLNLAREDGKDKACKKEFKAAEADVNSAFAVYDECKDKEALEMIDKAIEKINALCPYIPPPPPPPLPAIISVPEVIVVPEVKPAPVEKVIDQITLHINFDFDKSIIKKSEYPKLEKALAFISKYPEAFLVLEGHTDSIGTESYNDALSYRRANAVKEYFTIKGNINDSRIRRISGYGELRPVSSNKTAQGRADNRRTVVLIVSDEE